MGTTNPLPSAGCRRWGGGGSIFAQSTQIETVCEQSASALLWAGFLCSVCVCMYVCMHIYVYIYMCVYIYIGAYVWGVCFFVYVWGVCFLSLGVGVM